MATLLTKSTVDALKPGPARRVVWDRKVAGFGVRVTPAGAKSFVFVFRPRTGRAGRPRWYTIGTSHDYTVEKAREEAQKLRGDVLRGIDPVAQLKSERAAADAAKKAPKRSVEVIAADFVTRYAKPRNRSWRETQRIFERYVVPAWGKRRIDEIGRSHVNELLDAIEDKSGAPMANAVLAQVRKLFNWYATRDDRFNSPIVRGMARTNPKQMRRDRILSDDEIRALWTALDASPAPYRQLVRFLLLTAQRREEAAQMRKGELLSADLWEIPGERFKTGKPQAVPLSGFANDQLEALGQLRELGDFLFTTTGNKPFSGYSKAKRKLDVEMARLWKQANGAGARNAQLKPWRLHDLRRTAKTLMQRAGVRPDISERVLGHTIPGVEGTYDRYTYVSEKRQALCALATQVRFILADIGSEFPRIADEITTALELDHYQKVVPLKLVAS